MKRYRFGTALALLAALSACGGGGSSSGSPPVADVPTTPVTPPPTGGNGCSLRERQNFVAAQLNEFYLFPETLPADRTPTETSVQAYIDRLTATARAQGRDRGFTFITSIAEENAFFNSGSSAGFGVRLVYDAPARRLLVSEAFEGAPALAAGIDRGTEILAIGAPGGALRTVSDLFAAGGEGAVSDALGPTTAGTTRTLRVSSAGATRDVTVTKADFTLTPVSSRYGAQVIEDGGRRVGYLNLRTFISTADPALRQAFAGFRAQGVTDVVVDFRYNGGGLVRTAELMGDLLGANRSTSDVFSFTVFRPEKAAENETRFFRPQAESIAPTRLAFISTGATASASELVVNSFVPYLRTNMALVGANSFGKPVGQIAIDRAACDDRLRIVAFATQNAERRGDYFNGLATTVPVTCRAPDDLSRPLGNPAEGSTRAALDFLAGRTCAPISDTGARTASADRVAPERFQPLTPERPTTAQREVPGAF